MRCASSFTRLKPGNKWKKAEKCCENLQFLFLKKWEWWMGERGKSKIDRQKRECNGPMFGFVNTQTAHIEVDKQESRTIHLLFLHFVSYILLELLSCGVLFSKAITFHCVVQSHYTSRLNEVAVLRYDCNLCHFNF